MYPEPEGSRNLSFFFFGYLPLHNYLASSYVCMWNPVYIYLYTISIPVWAARRSHTGGIEKKKFIHTAVSFFFFLKIYI